MEISSVSRTTAPVAPAPVQRMSVEAVPPPETPQQAVQQPAAVIEQSSADARRRAVLLQQLNEQERGGFVQDPSIKEMVYRVTDDATGTVVLQLPTEEALKMRAYREAVEKSQIGQSINKGVTA